MWLAVGDSFTLSLQVAAADTFESRLGGLLGAPVLNAGIDGYSTWQATGRYQQVDAAVGSEVILLTYFLGNDLNDNEVFPKLLQGHSSARPGGAGPGGGPPRAPGPPGPTIQKPGMGFVEGLLFRHSHLYAYLRVASARRALQATDTREAQKFKGEMVPFTVAGAERLAQLVQQSEGALREFRDVAAARGDRVLVAVAPPAFAVSEARARDTLGAFGLDGPAVTAPARAVVDLLGRLSIPACDLAPALSAAELAGEAPYLRYDGHWSARGHAVVAETLAACARAEGLAP